MGVVMVMVMGRKVRKARAGKTHPRREERERVKKYASWTQQLMRAIKASPLILTVQQPEEKEKLSMKDRPKEKRKRAQSAGFLGGHGKSDEEMHMRDHFDS